MAYSSKSQRFRQRVHDRNDPLVGCWATLNGSTNAEVMAYAGLDFVLVDNEHGLMSAREIFDLVRRLSSHSTAVILRTKDKNAGLVGEMLDIGVDGFVFPKVESAEEAKALVIAAQFPPHGSRGLAINSIPATSYGVDANEYYRVANDSFTLFCQIETRRGVDQAEQICAVDRVDGLFLGPNDLSADLGDFRNYDNAEFKAARDKVEQAARRHNKRAASIPHGATQLRDLLDRGYTLIPAASDVKFLRDGVAALTKQLARVS